MNVIVEPRKEIPVIDHVDVLVVGGGPAGMMAAIAAARKGAKTALVERYGFLGGMATNALVGPLCGCRHRYGGGRVLGGIPWEMILRMEKEGGAILDGFDYSQHAAGDSGKEGGSTTVFTSDRPDIVSRGDIPFDAEVLKRIADEMVQEAGVHLYFHSYAASVITQNAAISSVIIENKSGRQAIRANIVIDASGDADIAFYAGVPCQKGREEDGKCQPMSLIFHLGGVDTDALGDITRPFVHPDIQERAQRLVEIQKLPQFGGPWTCWGSVCRKGEVMVNMVRLWGDGTRVEDLTNNEIKGRAHIQQFVQFLQKHFPEFRDCYLQQTGSQIGIRETRRIVGLYQLTADDILHERDFDDSIALGSHIMDIHSPDGTFTQIRRKVPPFQIPYRCLIPKKIENLFVAGKPISATHEAHAALRVMGTAMALGQSAGFAAAIAVEKHTKPSEIDVSLIQAELQNRNAPFKRGIYD